MRDISCTEWNHPLARMYLTRMRAMETGSTEFRRCMRILGGLLAGPVFASLPVRQCRVETPLAGYDGVAGAAGVVLVPILRAGLGLLEGMWEMVPDAAIGHVGLYRDEGTLRPVSYYEKFPAPMEGAFVVVLDPMLATGHSASAALDRVFAHGPGQVTLATVLACERGIEEVGRRHPKVRIVTLAIDPELNAQGYIVPGLGDAGDRFFGT